MTEALNPQQPQTPKRSERALLAGILEAAPWVLSKNEELIERANRQTLADLEDLRANLLGPSPSAIEAAIVGAAVVGWLHARVADMSAGVAKDLRQRDFHLRAAERGNRRFLVALRTLATVRRLVGPQVLQVNIAEQQVNLAAPEVGGGPLGGRPNSTKLDKTGHDKTRHKRNRV